MSKMGSMTHLDIWNTSYGQKKGWEPNWQFDSRPQKGENQPDSFACRWRATYHWKAFDEATTLLQTSSQSMIYKQSYGVPKSQESQLWQLSGSPETKCHLDVGLVERHIIYYKGEGGGFPQVRTMVSLVSSSLPVAHPCTKSASAMH
jgi:hypothetical protein